MESVKNTDDHKVLFLQGAVSLLCTRNKEAGLDPRDMIKHYTTNRHDTYRGSLLERKETERSDKEH